jgi:isopentenyldiphosphate isomerase
LPPGRPRLHIQLQRRDAHTAQAAFKEGWPDKWDITVGGSAISGDSSVEAAEREVREELGYLLTSKTSVPLTVNADSIFDDFYLIEREVDIESLSLQYEEVKEVKWATKDLIFSMLDSGEFIPYHKSFIQTLFAMRFYPGVHRP